MRPGELKKRNRRWRRHLKGYLRRIVAEFRSIRLITSDWHMRRARYEFRRVLGDRYEVVVDAVRTHPSLTTLYSEYNKYLLRRIAALFEN